jgi:hypothetical protein
MNEYRLLLLCGDAVVRINPIPKIVGINVVKTDLTVKAKLLPRLHLRSKIRLYYLIGTLSDVLQSTQ